VSGALRVALLQHDLPASGGPARQLAHALARAGAAAELVAPRGLPDAALRLRKIGDRPGRMPAAFAALARGRFDLAHAFTAQDAVAALPWGRLTGRPVLFSPPEPLNRANVADRRLRLALLRLAVERSSTVVAPDEEVAASLRRWLAAEADVLSPGDGAGHLDLYARLLRR
jgi:hypothetical protein